MFIPRWLQIDIPKSIILIGIRRAGKTTLLRHYFPNCKYITLDDFDYLNAAEEDPKGLLLSEKKEVIIIDEIQRVPKLLVAVKERIDNHQQKILMTGSSTLGLLSSTAETLAGRIRIFECPTFCFGEEFGPPLGKSLQYRHSSVEHKTANRELKKWFLFGGFPEVVANDKENDKKEILFDYKNTFFTKDLMLLSNIEDARGLLGVLNYLGTSICSRIDISSVAKESGIAHPTAKKYLNALNSSRMVFHLTGYQFGPAKRQLKSSKYYYSDISIPIALNLQLSEGQLFELLVISELEKRRKLGRFNCDFFYYYESEKGSEIDLVIDEGNLVTAIEIKNTKRPQSIDVKNLVNFTIKKDANLRKILICQSSSFSFIKDIEIWPITSLFRTL